MTHGEKAIAAKSNGLSSIPMTHAVEGVLTPTLTPTNCSSITMHKP